MITIRSATDCVSDVALLLFVYTNKKIYDDDSRSLDLSFEEIHRDLKNQKENRNWFFIIEDENRPIGHMSYSILEPSERDEDYIKVPSAEPNITIWFESDRSKGHGTSALRLLIKHIFEQGIAQIVIHTGAPNDRARYVYETKLGMTLMSVEDSYWIDSKGVRHDDTTASYLLQAKDFK